MAEAREGVAGAHPIYRLDDVSAKAEYERVAGDRDRYIAWHARADAEAERYLDRVQHLEFGIEQLMIELEKQATGATNGDGKIDLYGLLSRLDKIMESKDAP